MEAVRFVSDLSDAKLAVVAWMSLRGEAKMITRHLKLTDLATADGLKTLYGILDKRYLKQAHEQCDYI